jgi:ATP-dependent Lhr-like helicase
MGILSVGPQGERSYGYRHFLDLTSAFTSDPVFVVRHGSREVGYLDPISLLTADRHFATVLLAGRTWKITAIDWDRHFAWVEPATTQGKTRWLGEAQPLSAPLCDAIRNVLSGVDPPGVKLTHRAATKLEEIRSSFTWVQPGRTALVHSENGTRWWTFAGLRANAGLMAGMGDLLGGTTPDNLLIDLDPETATVDAVKAFASSLEVDNLPASWVAAELAQKLKFSDCLPEHIALDIAETRLSDPAGITSATTMFVDRSTRSNGAST